MTSRGGFQMMALAGGVIGLGLIYHLGEKKRRNSNSKPNTHHELLHTGDLSSACAALKPEARLQEFASMLEVCLHMKKNNRVATCTMPEELRKTLSFTVSISFSDMATKGDLSRAVGDILQELKLSFIETLVLETSNSTQLHNFWEELNLEHEAGRVHKVVVCRQSLSDLRKLMCYKFKPVGNRIPLSECYGSAFDALVDYAQENKLSLISEPKSLCGGVAQLSHINDAMDKYLPERAGDGPMAVKWAATYVSKIKCRTVLYSRGFLYDITHPSETHRSVR